MAVFCLVPLLFHSILKKITSKSTKNCPTSNLLLIYACSYTKRNIGLDTIAFFIEVKIKYKYVVLELSEVWQFMKQKYC